MALKILKKTTNLAEALQIEAFLKSQGIDCEVPNRSSDTFFNYLSQPRIWVDEKDYDEAKSILDGLRTNLTVAEIQIDDDSQKLKRALGAAILSTFIPVAANLYSLFYLFKVQCKWSLKFYIVLLINIMALSAYYFILRQELHSI